MRNMNNKGFTLIELVATVVILGIVMSIGGYAITELIQNNKEKSYKLLITEIKESLNAYYQECMFSSNEDVVCPIKDANGYYSEADFDKNNIIDSFTLGKLVDYGFLKGNAVIKEDDNKYTLVNPNDGKNISNCKIKYKYNNGKIIIEPVGIGENYNGPCPVQY